MTEQMPPEKRPADISADSPADTSEGVETAKDTPTSPTEETPVEVSNPALESAAEPEAPASATDLPAPEPKPEPEPAPAVPTPVPKPAVPTPATLRVPSPASLAGRLHGSAAPKPSEFGRVDESGTVFVRTGPSRPAHQSCG